jgi:hypothetical protein
LHMLNAPHVRIVLRVVPIKKVLRVLEPVRFFGMLHNFYFGVLMSVTSG